MCQSYWRGPWPSVNPDEALKTLGADFVIIGEGEVSFPELIEALDKNRPTESVRGVALLIKGEVNVNKGYILTEDELNTLPFPAWELLDHALYSQKHSMPAVGYRKYMVIITSRRCPYKCAYCYHTMGNTY